MSTHSQQKSTDSPPQISDILQPEHIYCGISCNSKKALFEKIAGLLAQQTNSVSAMMIFDSLMARERLGCTGLRNGIAIPHCRIAGITEVHTSFISLQDAVDFDGEAVSMLFVLLVSENYIEEHLQILSLLARLFIQPELTAALRDCDNAQCIYTLLTTNKA